MKRLPNDSCARSWNTTPPSRREARCACCSTNTNTPRNTLRKIQRGTKGTRALEAARRDNSPQRCLDWCAARPPRRRSCARACGKSRRRCVSRARHTHAETVHTVTVVVRLGTRTGGWTRPPSRLPPPRTSDACARCPPGWRFSSSWRRARRTRPARRRRRRIPPRAAARLRRSRCGTPTCTRSRLTGRRGAARAASTRTRAARTSRTNSPTSPTAC
mmetsp:Transcript_11200/g.47784  ORF Transcript_11200/g.47784 Transcript_11200/m.47784 type:complete len:217 (-) Transcript_11200:236-886(-)